MKKVHLTAVLALTCLLGVGISASAQEAGGVIANVPFEFVAGGKTMPPGTYRIGRVSSVIDQDLIIRGDDDGVLVTPAMVDVTPSDRAGLSFQHVGNKYFLSSIETPTGVYSFGTPRAMTKVAQINQHHTVSPSGTNTTSSPGTN